ncbi:hypothetical protein BYT27DRAFT_7203010 [Phlegmacium glaucopus]|nr:hypothetical protein BYT27DRAFT_7203010 [Phlegmacium glaucopus]
MQTSKEILLDNDKALLLNGIFSSGVGDVGLIFSEGRGVAPIFQPLNTEPIFLPVEGHISHMTDALEYRQKLKDKTIMRKLRDSNQGSTFCPPKLTRSSSRQNEQMGTSLNRRRRR